jgi:predicted dehydrogenase
VSGSSGSAQSGAARHRTHPGTARATELYEIRALSAHNAGSPRSAGELFGVGAVFSDHEQLLTQPDVDVVAITVKVPHHR